MNLETTRQPPGKNQPKAESWLPVALIGAAAALRIRGAMNDLSLDEIVSINDVRGISSAFQVFTKLHIDNNHYLNSLWLYFAGFRGDWPGYRMPSIIAGIGTVILAWFIGRRRSAGMAWIATYLVGSSYVLILYSDQARGYSCEVFFAFLCYYFLEIYLEKRKVGAAFLFGFGAAMGLLSHTAFLAFFAATLPWVAWRLFQLRSTPARIIADLLLCYAVPSLLFAALYLADIRHMGILGGTPTTVFDGYSTALAYAFPPIAQGTDTIAMFIIVVAGLAAGGWVLWRERSDSLIFFAGAIVVFPLGLVILGSSLLYVRYFIIGIAFGLVLLSIFLAWLWPRRRVLCAALLLAYAIANGRCILILFNDGQGNYSEAVRILTQQTRRPIITVGGDQDFRIGVVLQFYCGQLPGNREVLYYPMGNWPQGGPEWVIYQKESYELPVPRRAVIGDGQHNHYALVKIIPAAPLSAQHWFIYHNVREMTNDE